MSDPTTRPSYHPHNAGQWLMLGLLWLIGRLPPKAAFAIGEWAGLLLRLSRRRRRIALRNLELCFPELGQAQREHLVRENLRYMGRAIAETALAWFGGKSVDEIPCEVRGFHHLQAAQEDGSPVILLSGHFLCVELAARLIGPKLHMAVIYKPLRKKPIMDRAMLRSRSRTLAGAIPRNDLRSIIRTLRGGTPIWYAGDQDYGVRNSVFVPFMGVPAATITGLTRLSKLGKARVVPLSFNVDASGDGYEVTLGKALEGFPTGSDILDAQWMNAVLERGIRAHPEQYLWVHRRFKHPPPGERPAYRNSLQKPYNRVKGAPW
ncbi:LpxL/LpxP family acyltransferase [Spiribacter onubensis]|uniref:Lipid A biosynthesis acyltransferase n=1 Tax=Spiribacter onubensis TaxID=3122420 RepID=A0ABV3SA57_9GAMM